MEGHPMRNLSATVPLMALIPKPFIPATPTGHWELLTGWSRAFHQFYGHPPNRIDLDILDLMRMATHKKEQNPISTISEVTGCNNIYVREHNKITHHCFLTIGKRRLHHYSPLMLP